MNAKIKRARSASAATIIQFIATSPFLSLILRVKKKGRIFKTFQNYAALPYLLSYLSLSFSSTVARGVYTQTIIDDRDRFNEDFSLSRGGIAVGTMTLQDIEAGRIEGLTVMRLI